MGVFVQNPAFWGETAFLGKASAGAAAEMVSVCPLISLGTHPQKSL